MLSAKLLVLQLSASLPVPTSSLLLPAQSESENAAISLHLRWYLYSNTILGTLTRHGKPAQLLHVTHGQQSHHSTSLFRRTLYVGSVHGQVVGPAANTLKWKTSLSASDFSFSSSFHARSLSTGVSLSAHGLCYVSHKETFSPSVFLDRFICLSLIVFATDAKNKHLKLWIESCSRKKQEGYAFVSRIRFFTHGNLFTWLVQSSMVVRRIRLSPSRFLQHVRRSP